MIVVTFQPVDSDPHWTRDRLLGYSCLQFIGASTLDSAFHSYKVLCLKSDDVILRFRVEPGTRDGEKLTNRPNDRTQLLQSGGTWRRNHGGEGSGEALGQEHIIVVADGDQGEGRRNVKTLACSLRELNEL